MRNRGVSIFTDNQGVVAGYKKGHSTESLAWSALKALKDVGRALNCPVEINWQRRCSDSGSLAADLLSKARVDEARDLMPNPAPFPGFVSRSLMAWLEEPVVTRSLGYAIIEELRAYGVPVLTHFFEDEEEVNSLLRVSASP